MYLRPLCPQGRKCICAVCRKTAAISTVWHQADASPQRADSTTDNAHLSAVRIQLSETCSMSGIYVQKTA